MSKDRAIQLRVQAILVKLGATHVALTTDAFPVSPSSELYQKQKTCHGDYSAMYDEKRLAGEVLTGKQTGLSLLRDRCQIGGIVTNYDIPTVAGPISVKIEIVEYLKENFGLEILGMLGNDDEICIWKIRRE